MKKLLLFFTIFCFTLFSCTDNNDNNKDEQEIAPEGTYKNPVILENCPDPSVFKGEDGYFYLYSTQNNLPGNTRYIPIHRSKDLVRWEYIGDAFSESNRPKWVSDAKLWAPDMNYINGKYVLYYSMGTWGATQNCAIGAATADSPAGPFIDSGKIIDYSSQGVDCSIDQFYIEDKGKKYLVWGSFHGIYAIELTDNGLAVKPGAKKVKICGNQIEGSYIVKRKGYFYLIGSSGTCCVGAESTYHLICGKSKNVLGPYLTRDGKKMLDGEGSLLLRGNEIYAGVGHNAEFVIDDNGDYWILYHAYQKENPELGRVLMLDKVLWDDWGPNMIENTTSTDFTKAPVLVNGTGDVANTDFDPQYDDPIVPVSKVKLDEKTLSLAIGDSKEMTAKVEPDNATNKDVLWTSSNEKVVSIDAFGKITAVGIGKATIKVTTEDGNKSDECEITVVKGFSIYPEPPVGEKRLPAWRIADKNMGSTSAFSTKEDYATDGTQMFSHTDAIAAFGKGITINDIKYHIPTLKELNGILYSNSYKNHYINFCENSEAKDYANIAESIQIGIDAEPVTYLADYKFVGAGTTTSNPTGITYAVKFKPKEGSDYSKICAYRYEFKNCGSGNTNAYLEIKVRYIGDNITVSEIANDDFWNQNAVFDRIIKLSAVGYYSNSGKAIKNIGNNGYYWTADENPDNTAQGFGLVFQEKYLDIAPGSKLNGRGIRLFED